MIKNKRQKNKGFTLVELLVSLALFTIVLTIVLGTIFTIMDANRKARSLSLVMNNLDFAVESMVRTIKTARDIDPSGSFVSPGSKLTVIDQDNEVVTYKLENGAIKRNIQPSTEFISVTSPEITITNLTFTNPNGNAPNTNQPRIIVNIMGKAQVGPRISSDFSIQTTISQRDLNIE